MAGACQDPPLQPLSDTLRQSMAAHVVVYKSHCSSLEFMKLMFWSNLSGMSPKSLQPVFGYLGCVFLLFSFSVGWHHSRLLPVPVHHEQPV